MKTLPPKIPLYPDLTLEKIAACHIDELFQQIDRHRDYLSQFVNWTGFNTKRSDTADFVQKCQAEAEKGISYVWAICEQGKAVGTISFNAPIEWEKRTAYIGYWLSPDAQGKGVITQSVNTLIDQTSPLFHLYIIKCAVHNLRSNMVAMRCGFKFLERLKNAEQIGKICYDQNVYQKWVRERK